MNILVIEDGFEYSELLKRFLGDDTAFEFHRVQNGEAAIQALATGHWESIVLDLCFDRIPVEELLGDLDVVAEQFNGRHAEGLQYIIRNQGIFILSAIRDAGFNVPVLMSHDYSREANRWRRLVNRYGPLQYVSDNAGPEDIKGILMELGR